MAVADASRRASRTAPGACRRPGRRGWPPPRGTRGRPRAWPSRSGPRSRSSRSRGPRSGARAPAAWRCRCSAGRRAPRRRSWRRTRTPACFDRRDWHAPVARTDWRPCRAPTANGIEIEYDTFGDADRPGPAPGHGLHRPDDGVGRGVLQAPRRPGLLRHPLRQPRLRPVDASSTASPVDLRHRDGQARWPASELPPVPYLLTDMAADAIGLLDHLGIDRAHIVGASMGGMIVQTMAIEHPERVLVADVDHVDDRRARRRPARPRGHAAAARRRRPTERDGYIEQRGRRPASCSPAQSYFDEDRIADAGRRRPTTGRFYPEGAPRQLAGILASGSRADGLRALDVPTLVIHGARRPARPALGRRAHRRARPRRRSC